MVPSHIYHILLWSQALLRQKDTNKRVKRKTIEVWPFSTVPKFWTEKYYPERFFYSICNIFFVVPIISNYNYSYSLAFDFCHIQKTFLKTEWFSCLYHAFSCYKTLSLVIKPFLWCFHPTFLKFHWLLYFMKLLQHHNVFWSSINKKVNSIINYLNILTIY